MKTAQAVIPTDRTSIPPRLDRRLVTITVTADGLLQVYGEALDVHIEQLLKTADGESDLADQIAELRMPLRHRRQWRGRPAATALLRPRTAEQEIQRLADLDLIRAIREAAQ